MITLAHLSDLHFGRERQDVVAGLLASLAEQQPDTVIISGDLTQRARHSEYAAAQAFISRIGRDCLIIPGNHDIAAFNFLERFLYPWAKWRNFFGETLETEQDKAESLLLGINTTRRLGSLQDWSRGRISDRQIQQIRGRLSAAAPQKLRLLVAHHPFWLPAEQQHRGLIGNHQEALAALGDGQLDLIVSGHVHLAFNRVENGIIVSHAGSSTSDRLLSGHPNSYKLIHGDRNALNISLFVWNGEQFTCQEVETFIRREKGWTGHETAGKAADRRGDKRQESQPIQKDQTPLPVFLNTSSGSAEQALAALKDEPRIRLNCLSATEMKSAIDRQVASGSPRIAVCGGDGTLALAAARLAGSATELAVLPGGTLNHFAGRHAIPGDLSAALELALTGQAEAVAAGYVNDHLFLNTSSIGAYVLFVRTREQLKKKMSYSAASLLAGLRRLLRFRSARIRLNGQPLRSPLVFVGVQERDVQFPLLGQDKSAGSEGLHVIAIKADSGWESLKIAAKAILCGTDPLERAKDVENLLLEKLELNYRGKKRRISVALDGELLTLQTPLNFRYQPQAFRAVLPPD